MTMRQLTESRFAMGMTFDDYVTYFSGVLRESYDRLSPNTVQTDAIRWLAARPDGPARLALRIFTRDGVKVRRGAAVDEMLSALYERVVVGGPA